MHSDFDGVPELLTRRIRGFDSSIEWSELDSSIRDIPYVAGAAFAQFVARIEERVMAGEVTPSSSDTLHDCYELIEELSHTADPQLRDLVVWGMFDAFRCDGKALASIRTHLHEVSATLYAEWEGIKE
jgi:hypothetical protein